MKIKRRPQWLKKKIDFDRTHATRALLNQFGLNTVCQEAKCPNISECFKNKHATFLILGKYCTRNCSFCNVEKLKPLPLDEDEPKKVACAVKAMGLKHAVITSVTRDDLPDGGACVFIKTVSEIRKLSGAITIELLIPDFNGDEKNIRDAAKNKPDIIGHNIETVPRLYSLRPQADYRRSLLVLKYIKDADKNIRTKSALMLGLGEKKDEVIGVMKDLRKVGCDFLALGQYLQPSIKNIEVAEYIPPEQFQRYKSQAIKMGFKHVESGPYVRSSYRATHFA